MLIAVVVMVALVLLALAVAAPIIAKDLRREKELESEHRAQQYVRALRLYYRQLKTYPPSLEALQKSNNIRFLRQQYVDPLTGKADWRLIHVGEQKTTVKGFFGEPLSGLNATGLGNSLGSASSLGSGGFGSSSTSSSTSTIGATSGLAAGFAGATIGSSTTTTTGGGTAGTGGSAGGTGPANSSGLGSGLGSQSGSGSGFGSGSSGFGSGGLGQIMGVGSARSGASILTPNEQTTYDTWEFLYDPRIEQLYAKSNILGGGLSSQPASALGKGTLNGLSGASGAAGSSGATGANGATGSTGPSNPLFR